MRAAIPRRVSIGAYEIRMPGGWRGPTGPQAAMWRRGAKPICIEMIFLIFLKLAADALNNGVDATGVLCDNAPTHPHRYLGRAAMAWHG